MAEIKRGIAYYSVDVETAGPSPLVHSMLALGAVYIDDLEKKEFYVELKPTSNKSDPKALKVNGFDLSKLMITGQEPESAMLSFSDWVKKTSGGKRPVFVSYGTFDWMFVQAYLSKYTGEMPFGPNGLDLKSFGMGVLNLETWRDTTEQRIMDLVGLKRDPLNIAHNALHDAREQARLFNLLQDLRSKQPSTKLRA